VSTVSLANAKARLGELVRQAAAGETVRILRRGRPVAQLTAVKSARRFVDPAALRAVTDAMPAQNVSGGDFIRRMRGEDRYCALCQYVCSGRRSDY
jgi:prevent-host-death family protein